MSCDLEKAGLADVKGAIQPDVVGEGKDTWVFWKNKKRKYTIFDLEYQKYIYYVVE